MEMPRKQLEYFGNMLYRVDPEIGKGFFKSKNPYDYLRNIQPTLKESTEFTDLYNSIDDILAERANKLNKLWKDNKYQPLTTAQTVSFIKKNPEFDSEEVTNYINKQMEYKKYYEDERAKKAGNYRRYKEVKDDWSFLKNMLTSDYEKQRYIDNPQEALVGKEAPSWGSLPAGQTRWAAMGDMAAGGAAAAADIGTSFMKFTPGSPLGFILNTTVGPTIRAGRDIAHTSSDSPYKKDWGDIATQTIADMGTNLLTAKLANARRANKITGDVAQTSSPTYKLYKETQNIDKGINDLSELIIKQDKPLSEVMEFVKTMPESNLKKDVTQFINSSLASGKKVDTHDIVEIIMNYKDEIKPAYQAKALEILNKGERPEGSDYLLNVITTPRPTAMNKLGYKVSDVVDNINSGNLGTALFETGKTLSGVRDTPTAEWDINTKEETAERNTKTNLERMLLNKKKEDFKKSEERFWEAGFAPKKMEGDPLWEAYKEWYKEKYGIEYEGK